MKKFKKSLTVIMSIFMTIGLTMVGYASSDSENVPVPTQAINDFHVDLIEDNGQPYQEVVIYTNPFLKANGTYETTYDMTGGVYTKQSWAATTAPTFDVTITPTSFEGASDTVNMGIYLEKKSGNSWKRVAEDSVTLRYGGSVTLDGDTSGTYRLYFRNWSGFRATGDIFISYSY